jgi:hypothetical protein
VLQNQSHAHDYPCLRIHAPTAREWVPGAEQRRQATLEAVQTSSWMVRRFEGVVAQHAEHEHQNLATSQLSSTVGTEIGFETYTFLAVSKLKPDTLSNEKSA